MRNDFSPRDDFSMDYARRTFVGVETHRPGAPMDYLLNDGITPDRRIRAVPPSKYAADEKRLLEKAFLEEFNKIED